jgi:hypothetical protein
VARSSAPSCAEELLSAPWNSGVPSRRGGQAPRRTAGGAQRLRSGDASTASQQRSCRLEKSSSTLLQAASPSWARGRTPAFHLPCFARSSADVRSASQTGSWIGTVLEAQRPQCRHHPAPTLESLIHQYCPLPHPLHAAYETIALLFNYSKCRPSTHCARRGGCHSLASVCHFGACSHPEEVRLPTI